MSVSRSLALSAILGWVMCGAMPATGIAQVYEDVRRSVDLSPDPIARSPRLLGMGQLTLAADGHNRLQFWDFALNPIGLLDADSSSTFELRPGTASSAGFHDDPFGRERQVIGTREARLGYEAWRRTGGGNVYGFAGEVTHLSVSRPFDGATELRRAFDMPRITGVLSGRLPFVAGDRMRYELHAGYTNEAGLAQYRTQFSNAAGDYLGRESDVIATPDPFSPDEVSVSTLTTGLGASYRVAPWLTAAGAFELASSRFEEKNETLIHVSDTGADRPYLTWRFGAAGNWGDDAQRLEYIYDVSTWRSEAETRWRFSLKAGLNQDPFTGRGKMLDREEDGLSQRARVRFLRGALELGASYDDWTRTVDVTPPPVGDPESFNYFLNVAANRDGADSLSLPDSVRANSSEESVWRVAYGASWKLSRGLVGVEYHYAESALEQDLAGEGPKRKVWDVRSGFEYPCAPALAGRLGYIYRSDDRDLFTNRNEFTSHTLTLGAGLQLPGSVWGLDLGYAVEWLSPDFDAGDESRESRQRLGMQLRWVF